MNLVDEIREGFASLVKYGARELVSLPKEYPGYVIRLNDGYGVAIEVNDEMEISEHFNSCRLFTGEMFIDKDQHNYLMLCSPFEEYRYEFATLCSEFLEPGDGGKERKALLTDPIGWWERWKGLVGNTSREQQVYDVIAEMLVLSKKLDEDPSTEWAALRRGSHDIECKNESCEVKSTIKRYGANITISGQHQLECAKRLWLYFCRLEESMEGTSINEARDNLVKKGYNEGKLEDELAKLGFEKGASIRDRKYKVLEKRKYEVDDNFPKIINESFKGDKLPDSITHIEYTVDLDSISYTDW